MLADVLGWAAETDTWHELGSEFCVSFLISHRQEIVQTRIELHSLEPSTFAPG